MVGGAHNSFALLMAHYEFYRQSQAGWGTPGFQGVPPPAPLYQPQPNCQFLRQLPQVF